MKQKDLEFKHDKVLAYFSLKLNEIHKQIGIVTDSNMAKALVLQLKEIKTRLIEIKAAFIYDDNLVKKCNKLIERAQHLIAYFSVFVEKTSAEDAINDEYCERLQNLDF